MLSRLTNSVVDAYPGLRGWRDWRLGALAIAIEGGSALFLFVYYSGFGEDVQRHVSAPVDGFIESLFRVATYTILSSSAVAFIGLIADRKKIPSVIALASLFPMLMLLGIWAGKW